MGDFSMCPNTRSVVLSMKHPMCSYVPSSPSDDTSSLSSDEVGDGESEVGVFGVSSLLSFSEESLP